MVKYFFICLVYMFAAVQAVNGQDKSVTEISEMEADSLRQSAHSSSEIQDYSLACENYGKVANSKLALLDDVRNYADSIHRLLDSKSRNDISYLPLLKEWGEISLKAATHPQHEIQDLRNVAGIYFSSAEDTNDTSYAKTALRFREEAMNHPHSTANDTQWYEQTKSFFFQKFGALFLVF